MSKKLSEYSPVTRRVFKAIYWLSGAFFAFVFFAVMVADDPREAKPEYASATADDRAKIKTSVKPIKLSEDQRLMICSCYAAVNLLNETESGFMLWGGLFESEIFPKVGIDPTDASIVGKAALQQAAKEAGTTQALVALQLWKSTCKPVLFD